MDSRVITIGLTLFAVGSSAPQQVDNLIIYPEGKEVRPVLADSIVTLLRKGVTVMGLQDWRIEVRFAKLETDSSDWSASSHTMPEYRRALLQFDLADLAHISRPALKETVIHELLHLPESIPGRLLIQLASYDPHVQDMARKTREEFVTVLARMPIWDKW